MQLEISISGFHTTTSKNRWVPPIENPYYTSLINEKIYVFLWFWFLLLTVLTFLVVMYRFIIIVSPRMRAYLLYIRFRLIKKECINVIIKKTQMGDFFLLYMLGQNVDSMIFKEVLHELARRLGYQSKDLIDF